MWTEGVYCWRSVKLWTYWWVLNEENDWLVNRDKEKFQIWRGGAPLPRVQLVTTWEPAHLPQNLPLNSNLPPPPPHSSTPLSNTSTPHCCLQLNLSVPSNFKNHHLHNLTPAQSKQLHYFSGQTVNCAQSYSCQLLVGASVKLYCHNWGGENTFRVYNICWR